MDSLPFRPTTKPWPEGFEFPDEREQQQAQPVSDQWVSSVPRFSSRFGTHDNSAWSAEMIVGPPRVPAYGDNELAWAPEDPGTPHEWVELQFARPCRVCRVRIHESFCPGALARISLWDGNDYVAAHEQEPRCGQYPREMRWEEVDIDYDRQIVTDRIRLDLNQTGGLSWYEIDAVQISGVIIQEEEEPPSELATALGTLLGDRTTADCTLIVRNGMEDQNEVHIPVHRGILAARCPLFRAMLNRNELPLDGVQHMTGISPDLLQVILGWIYTGQVKNLDGRIAIDQSNCVCLTVASDYFQTNGLTTYCVNFFCQHVLTCKNAAILYAHFDEICVEPLKQACRQFCGQHFLAVSQTDAFPCLSKSQLLSVIECHNDFFAQQQQQQQQQQASQQHNQQQRQHHHNYHHHQQQRQRQQR